MGKKRRLNSAKIKFKAKHNNHPRAKLLAKRAQEPEEHRPTDEVVVQESPPKIELEAKAPPPEPKAKKVAQARKKTTTSRKRTTRSTKRTTKKKTTVASV
jgi:hypothetical protein